MGLLWQEVRCILQWCYDMMTNIDQIKYQAEGLAALGDGEGGGRAVDGGDGGGRGVGCGCWGSGCPIKKELGISNIIFVQVFLTRLNIINIFLGSLFDSCFKFLLYLSHNFSNKTILSYCLCHDSQDYLSTLLGAISSRASAPVSGLVKIALFLLPEQVVVMAAVPV